MDILSLDDCGCLVFHCIAKKVVPVTKCACLLMCECMWRGKGEGGRCIMYTPHSEELMAGARGNSIVLSALVLSHFLCGVH